VVHSYCSLRVLFHAEKNSTIWKTYYFDPEEGSSKFFKRNGTPFYFFWHSTTLKTTCNECINVLLVLDKYNKLWMSILRMAGIQQWNLICQYDILICNSLSLLNHKFLCVCHIIHDDILSQKIWSWSSKLTS
jgi:hypothetical protein